MRRTGGSICSPLLLEMARAWPGLEGTRTSPRIEVRAGPGANGRGGPIGIWRLGSGYETPAVSERRRKPRPATCSGRNLGLRSGEAERPSPPFIFGLLDACEQGDNRPHVVAIDYGAKHNIYRNLVKAGAKVSVLPATASFDQVMALKPDGIFLSNGPGDPAATGDYAVPVIQQLLDDRHMPLFGIFAPWPPGLLGARGRRVAPPRCSRGIAAPITRSSGWATARSRSPA